MKLEKAVKNFIRSARQVGQVGTSLPTAWSGIFDPYEIVNTSSEMFAPRCSEHFLFETTYKNILKELECGALSSDEKFFFGTMLIKVLGAHLADGRSRVIWLNPSSRINKAAVAIHIWKKGNILGVSLCELSRNGLRNRIKVFFAFDLSIMGLGTEVANSNRALTDLWCTHFATQLIDARQFDLLEVAAHLCGITETVQPVQPANCNIQPAHGQRRHRGRNVETNLPEGGISFAIRRLHYADGHIEAADVEPMEEAEYVDLVDDGHAMAANDDGMAGYEDLPVIDLDQRRRRENGPRVLHAVRGHWRNCKTKAEPTWIKGFLRGDPNKITLNKIVRPRKKRQQ